MEISQCHPSWPNEAVTSCPHCKGLLTDTTPCDYYDLVGQQNPAPKFEGPCPHCGKGIVVTSRTVTTYTAKPLPGAEKL